MTSSRLASILTRRAALAAAVATLSLSACFKVESRRGQEATRARLFVARAVVTAATGGTVAAGPDVPHNTVRVEVPPGALEEDTEISIYVRLGDPRLPQVVQAIELEPRGLELATAATLVVDYGPFYEEAFGALFPEEMLELFGFVDDPLEDCRYHAVEFRDTEQNLLRGQIDRLGSFFAMHTDVRRLGLRRAGLVDPATPVRAEFISGRAEAVTNGTFELQVGQGSLESFFRSPSTENLLVVHGLGDDALGVSSPSSLAPSDPDAAFNDDFTNVVVFEYASARSLAESGRVLYDEIRQRAREGFGTRILAHGTGGLVVRYALELADVDPDRPSARAGDPPLEQWVDRVVFVATPHRGSDLVTTRFADVLRATEFDDSEFVAGLLDLAPMTGNLVDRLALHWRPTTTRYFAIAGDFAGADNDGLVEVTSALELQDSAHPEAYQVFSGPLYNHLLLTALADRIGVVTQSRVWLGKQRTNQRPIVGSVETPAGSVAPTIRVGFTLSDPDEDRCTVTAEVSPDGFNWRPARDHVGRTVSVDLHSSTAPGRGYELAFSTLSSGFVIVVPTVMFVRLRVADALGDGTSGQTGAFVVEPRPRTTPPSSGK